MYFEEDDRIQALFAHSIYFGAVEYRHVDIALLIFQWDSVILEQRTQMIFNCSWFKLFFLLPKRVHDELVKSSKRRISTITCRTSRKILKETVYKYGSLVYLEDIRAYTSEVNTGEGATRIANNYSFVNIWCMSVFSYVNREVAKYQSYRWKRMILSCFM